MTQKNSFGPFHREPGLFAVNCCFCTAGINEGYPISENGKLVVLTSGGREFRQHAEHTKSGDTTPRLEHARMVCKSQFRQKQKRSRSPAGPRRLGTATRISTSLSRRLSAFLGSTSNQDPKAARFAVLNPGHAEFPKRVERSEGSNSAPIRNAPCSAV